MATNPAPASELDWLDGCPAAPAMDIAATAARIGEYVWISSRLFEVVGAWAVAEVDPARKAARAAVASRFAWQATELRDRLPFLREVDRVALIQPPEWSRLDALEAVSVELRSPTISALIRQLDELYARHIKAASPLRDGPLVRSLDRIRADLAATRAEFSDF